MNILVTGGAGYIGAHACKALAESGFTPIVYDNLIYGHRSAVKWGSFEHGDLLDRDRLDEVIRKYQPDAILHFAAYAYVGESVAHPAKYYENNVVGSLLLLESMRANDVNKIIFSSTCATYGIPVNSLISENHEQHPINPYGRTKQIIENMLSDFDSAYGIKSVSLRYFNAAGADPACEIGEQHDPETHLIPLILDVAAGKRKFITVYGNDYDTRDGSCIRDYIHVSDLADAHVQSLNFLQRGGSTNQYNLGNGEGFSVFEVIKAAEKITGKAIPIKIGQRRQGDPAKLVGDASKIRNHLNWVPKYADLGSIIQTAWNWHKSRI